VPGVRQSLALDPPDFTYQVAAAEARDRLKIPSNMMDARKPTQRAKLRFLFITYYSTGAKDF
jgi:hypothetical protein